MIKRCTIWLWKASKGIRFRLFVNIILGIVRIASGLLFIYVSKILIDMATHKLPSSQSSFLWNSIFLVLLIICQIIAGTSISWLSDKTEIRLKNNTRLNLFSRLMSALWDGKEKHHSGDVLNRMEEDVRIIADTICNAMPSLVVTCVQLFAAFFFLCQLSATMAWTILFILPAFLLLSKIYIKRTRQLTSDIRQSDSKVQSLAQESLQHRLVIQSLGQTRNTTEHIKALQLELFHRVMHRTRFNLFSRVMITVGFSAGYLIAFIWGITQLDQNAITFGTMTAFLQLVAQIQRPTVELTRQIPSFIYASTSIDRLAELEQTPTEEDGEHIELDGPIGIEMKNVTFGYKDGNRDILDHFNHIFKPLSRTAVVGETGSGKSTTIRLIMSLLHPQEGTIEIFNNEGEHIPVSAQSRCNLAYVPQENSLLSGSIRDNLRLGNPLADDEEMYDALHTAAADFVKDLPKGLDTICGEKGEGLSEGQSQRIAIARALLCKGNIMLLDEFSSSLDSTTENILMNRLTESCKNKTIIFVTHHESIIGYCNDVVRFVRHQSLASYS